MLFCRCEESRNLQNPSQSSYNRIGASSRATEGPCFIARQPRTPATGRRASSDPSDNYTLPAETGKDAAGANQLSDTGAGPQKDRIAQPTTFRMESCCPGWRVSHVCVLPQVQTQQRPLAKSGPCCCGVGGLCTGAVKTDETLVPRRFTTRCCCGWGCVAWQLQPDSPQIPSG